MNLALALLAVCILFLAVVWWTQARDQYGGADTMFAMLLLSLGLIGGLLIP